MGESHELGGIKQLIEHYVNQENTQTGKKVSYCGWKCNILLLSHVGINTMKLGIFE